MRASFVGILIGLAVGMLFSGSDLPHAGVGFPANVAAAQTTSRTPANHSPRQYNGNVAKEDFVGKHATASTLPPDRLEPASVVPARAVFVGNRSPQHVTTSRSTSQHAPSRGRQPGPDAALNLLPLGLEKTDIGSASRWHRDTGGTNSEGTNAVQTNGTGACPSSQSQSQSQTDVAGYRSSSGRPVPASWSDTAVDPIDSDSQQGSLIALTTPALNGQQHLVLIDSKTRSLATYHVDGKTGKVTLRCVRDIRWDLQMDAFNGTEPSPEQIKALLRSK